MFQNEMIAYIRENQFMFELAAAGVFLVLVLAVWIETIRIKREVHGVCKKIKRYFEVILKEETKETGAEELKTDELEQIPVYHTTDPSVAIRKKESRQTTEEEMQKQRDAKLLMDVIQDVF